MVAPTVQGIELFKIAGRSISGWMKSLKKGNAGPSSRGSTLSNLTSWSWIVGMDKQVALFNQTHPIFMSPGAM